MPTDTEDYLTGVMRRVAAHTSFDPQSIDAATARLRRRRLTLGAGAAALVIAGGTALGITVFDGGNSGNDDVVATTGEELPLLTQPEPGDTYPAANLQGTLTVAENQCLIVEIPEAQPPQAFSVYWPFGFTAARDASGVATVYDVDGAPVAREGDEVAIGGGLMPEDFSYPQGDHPCATGQVWLAAPEITVVAQRPSGDATTSAEDTLPSSGWNEGEVGHLAAFAGTLKVGEGDCLYAEHEYGRVIMGLLWPEGWTAERDENGVAVLDQAGEVALREGDRFEVAGAVHNTEQVCGQGVHQVFAMESRPTTEIG